MSETSKVALGREVSSLDISPQFDAYSGVEIIVTDEITYFAGNRTGRVLSIQNPWGTQAQATAILNALKAKGFQYQPYTADGAILNPAAEIGDGITISDTYSGLYKIDRKYSPLMTADVQAPQDEELDHEYPYTPKQDRIYKREIDEANAQISINANAITAEVNRASSAEGTLSSRITQTANAITTEVTNRTNADNNLNTTLTSKINQTATSINATVTTVNNNKLDHTRSNSTFGWSLTSSAFKINASGSKNVFTATKDGIVIQGNATVTGKIQATSGYIGSSAGNGFSINSSSISNGTLNANKDDLATSNGAYVNGVFIGKNKIRLGNNFLVTNTGAVTAKNLTLQGGSIKIGNNFTVTSAGNVTANNMTLSGTLTVGGSTITAALLRQGAERANSGYSNWNSAYSSTSAGGYCYNGAGYGYNFNNACSSSSTCSYFKATSLYCDNLYSYGNVYSTKNGNYLGLNGHSHVISVSGGTVTIGGASNQQGSFNIADTQYYKDGVESAYNDGYDDGYSSGASGVYIAQVRRSGQAYSDHVNVYVRLSNGESGTYSVFF